MGVFFLDDLTAYWELDEASGAVTRVDAHTAGHDFLPIGTGVPAQAFKLNNGTKGSDNVLNYLSIASHTDFDPTAAGGGMTIMCWASPANINDNQPIITRDDTGSRQWGLMGIQSTDKWRFHASNDGSSIVSASWGSTYSALGVYHIVCVIDWDNDRIGISVDRGAFVYTALTMPIPAATEVINLHHSLQANIAEEARCDSLGVWQRLLNTDEMDAHYNSGGVPPAYTTFVAGGPPLRPRILEATVSARVVQSATISSRVALAKTV